MNKLILRRLLGKAFATPPPSNRFILDIITEVLFIEYDFNVAEGLLKSIKAALDEVSDETLNDLRHPDHEVRFKAVTILVRTMKGI